MHALVTTDPSSAGAPRATSTRVLVLLALVVVGGAWLRFTGIDWLLPHYPEADVVKFSAQIDALRTGAAGEELEVNLSSYPSLVPRVAVLAPKLATPPAGAPLAEHLRAAAGEVVRLRGASAVLSLLAIVATFFLARRFVGSWPALAAATFVATSGLALWFAQQARPHAAACGTALLAVLAALRLQRHGRVRDYVGVGLAAGLAVGTLQSGLAVGFPIVAAFLLREREARRTRWAWAFASAALFAGVVFLFFPFLFVEQPQAGVDTRIEGESVSMFGHIVGLGLFNGGGFRVVANALRGYDPWIAGLAALGVIVALAALARGTFRLDSAHKRELAVVLCYVVPYLVAIGLYQRTYQRFVLPLIPYLAVFAAYFMARAARALAGRAASAQKAALAAALVAVCALGPQLYAAIRLVHGRAAPDTLTQTADWIRAHVPPDAHIAFVPPLQLPLGVDGAGVEQELVPLAKYAKPWFRYLTRLPAAQRPEPAFHLRPYAIDDAGRAAALADLDTYMRSVPARFVVIEDFTMRRWPLFKRMREYLAHNGTLRLRVSPDVSRGADDVGLLSQDDDAVRPFPWLWLAVHARAWGPVVEVWELEP